MRWTGHVARKVEVRNAYNIWIGNMTRRDNTEDLGVDGKILEWIVGK
jgi:hypothetical protein